MGDLVRVLFLADSHLGFDLPTRPRVERRRRGHDFLANYARALAPALAGEADLVIHGGDVFDRSRVHESVAFQALDPLRQIAERGTPVFIVPGNHERSRLPHARFAAHPNVYVFDRPRTAVHNVRGIRVALAGFPYERHDVRNRFPALVRETGWTPGAADVNLLCVHHCVEGATVGPGNYTFTTASDVIRHRDVPPQFDAVLSGHIHRHQVLTRDLRGRAVQVPVLYPGSLERTALAEIGEPKGYLHLLLDGSNVRWSFRELPARPMLRQEMAVDDLDGAGLERALRTLVASVPGDAVLSVRLTGSLTDAHWRQVRAARLRTYVPPTMNVEISVERAVARDRRVTTPLASASAQLSLLEP
jgi:DNA repair exonuclease SbcCD nuclease subunit